MKNDFEKELDDIEPVPIDLTRLAKFTTEEDFTGLGVDLLVEVGSYACVASCLLPGDTECWNRDQAIVGGNVVRLYKLISAVLDQTCKRRRETSFIFTRLAFEVIVNLKFLIKNASTELFESYIRYSLRHERKLHDRIQENIASRDGEVLPIETRMLNSIERTATKSEISIQDVSTSEPKNWGNKNIFERAKDVELDEIYLAAMGGGSHSVHGNWMDLLEYHLEDKEGGFGPNLEWRTPRPQVLYTMARLAAEAIADYVMFLKDENILDYSSCDKFVGRLTDVICRTAKTDETHEAFLTSGMG